MFDMLTGKYKNLASKGRNGDTMLAHINPQEAALLKSMGGAGTINPQTGLREFYGFAGSNFGFQQREPEPLPVLAQAFNPDEFKDVLDKLPTKTIPREYRGKGGYREAYEEILPEYSQYADRGVATGMGGGSQIEGYTVPTDKTFQGKPLEAKYDPKGNFINLQLAGGNVLIPDPNQPNIASSPRFNKTGGIIDYGIFDLNQQDDGGFGSFIGGLAEDFAPMILAGLGANYLAGSGLLSGGATAAGAGSASALSPYAAQAAGAYGGSAAAAQAAAAGSLAGIQAASAAQNALTQQALTGTGITFGQGATPTTPSTPSTPTPEAPPAPPEVPPAPTPPVVPPVAEASGAAAERAAAETLAKANIAEGLTTDAVTRAAAAAAGSGFPDLSSLGDVGTAIIDFAKANPSIAGSLIGAVAGAVGASNAPKEQTATTSIDPQIKAEYLANLERAKQTAAGLEARQFEGFTPSYLLAETQVQNLGLGGKGQQTTDEATRLAMIEAGFTPQQIQASQANRQNIQNITGQLGSQYMSAYQNPFEEQVVEGALGDIERARLMQEQANKAQAISARAFGGSRQGVVSGMTNEAALRQAATTGAQLRQAGFNTAAQFGQLDAARQLQAQMANQGVDISIEQANAQLRQQASLANQGAFAQGANIRQAAIGQLGQLGALQQNLGLTGANAVMEAQMRRQALAQARLDAARNLGTERLAITGGALGLQPANVGQTSTQPLYSSTTGSLLSGGLTGAYIGSLLGKA